MTNIIIYFSYFFLILISILGYGVVIKSRFKYLTKENCFGYTGIIGIFFFTIYSYISNFLIPHNNLNNIIFILLGIIFFIFFNKNRFQILKKEILHTLLIFLILSISILIFKSHDDFAYYHFPYSYYLIEQKMIIGIGQILQGFRTPSSIFYFNSLSYLPLAEYSLFNFFPVYILGFSNLILLKKILVINSKPSNLNYLSLLVFIFINIFFYRIGEHGTDRSAQILIFLLIIEILNQLNKLEIDNKNLHLVYILTSIIISLKAFYILYLLFLIPVFLIEIKKNRNLILFLNKFIFNIPFMLSSLLILLVLLSYFFNTGCIIYPVSFTCFENLSWAIDKSDVKSSNDWFELWSKAGATPNYVIENRDIYIQKFNWLNIWIKEYFFTKVSDFILGITFLCLVVCLSFIVNSKKNLENYKEKKNLSVYLIILFLFIEWFYNHPALRYGGYCIICLILFIPISDIIQSYNIRYKRYLNTVLILIIITSVTFVARNANRISNEIEFYGYDPFSSPSYNLEKLHFRMQKQMDSLILNFENCNNGKNTCDKNLKPKVTKVLGYYILNKN